MPSLFFKKPDGTRTRGKLVPCEYCHKEFVKSLAEVNRSKRHFCSRLCASKNPHKKNPVPTGTYVECACCSKKIYRKQSHVKRSKTGLFFCSRACQKEAHRTLGLDYLTGTNPVRSPLKKLTCQWCSGPIISRKNEKYCGRKCAIAHRNSIRIKNWKEGLDFGHYRGGNLGLKPFIRKYLLNKFDNECQVCGWSKTNPHSNKIPLTVHHIDGNPKNNKEENLQLLCPNCHSLTPNYGSLHKKSKRMRNKT